MTKFNLKKANTLLSATLLALTATVPTGVTGKNVVGRNDSDRSTESIELSQQTDAIIDTLCNSQFMDDSDPEKTLTYTFKKNGNVSVLRCVKLGSNVIADNMYCTYALSEISVQNAAGVTAYELVITSKLTDNGGSKELTDKMAAKGIKTESIKTLSVLVDNNNDISLYAISDTGQEQLLSKHTFYDL